MNARNALIFAAAFGLVGGLVAYFLKKQQEANEGLETPHAVNTPKAHKHVAHVVEDVLEKHQGEDSPVVQAFDKAVHLDKPA